MYLRTVFGSRWISLLKFVGPRLREEALCAAPIGRGRGSVRRAGHRVVFDRAVAMHGAHLRSRISRPSASEGDRQFDHHGVISRSHYCSPGTNV